MTQLPSRNEIIDKEINTGVWKVLYGNIRDFITQLPGGSTAQNIEIKNNTLTPSASFVFVAPENGTNEDIIETIKLDNLPDGSAIFLSAQLDNTSITIKHNFGGQGSIFLSQDRDLVLSNNFSVLLLRVGNYWMQQNTSGYLLDENGTVYDSVLPRATSAENGVSRFATSQEYAKGEVDNLFVSPKQVAGTINEINNKIENKIYPLTVYQTMKNFDTNVELEDGIVMYLTSIEGEKKITFDKSRLNVISDSYIFQVLLDVKVVSVINFPENVSWLNDSTPNIDAEKKYLFAFLTIDNGSTWVGNLQGYW